MNILIIGLGSHSQVVTQIIKDCYKNKIENIFYTSYSFQSKNLPDNYIGDIKEISNLQNYYLITAIGDNYLRKEIVEYIEKISNIKWLNVIHPHSYIADNVILGKGVLVSPGVAIQTGTVIGDHSIINTHASIDHHNKIGKYCHIAPNSTLCGGVNIENGSFIGAGTTIVPNIKLRAWSFTKANSLVKDSNSPIKIYEPYIKNYKNSVIKALETGWISSQGEFVEKASKKLEEILNVKHVILVSNGTCATHCLFLALKWKYPEINRIYVPNNVYVASWNAALMEYNASELQVMNINLQTWNIEIDDEYIKSLEENSAILIVHNVGNIINIPRLKRLRPDIIFIEDGCEGLFGKYENKYVGSSDDTLATAFSFFANKIITSGEGGAVTTNDDELYEYLKRKINQGMTCERYIHDIHAYNYRMTNIHAGLLYDQLIDLQNILDKKETIFKNYNNLIEKTSLKTFKIEENTIPAPWIYPIYLKFYNYKNIENFMKEKGIEIRPFFYPISIHKHLQNIHVSEIEKEKSEKLNKNIIMLPSYPELSYKEQEYIIESLVEYLNF